MLIRYKTTTQQYEDTLKNILCNSIQSVMSSRTYITVSLDKNNSTIPDRYNPVGLTYCVFYNVIKWLADNEYIHLYKAPRGPRVDVRSEFIVTSKLMDLINEYEISLADITLHRDNEPIELKRSKVLADYDDNEKTHKDRAILKRYTELLSSPWIKLKIDGKRIYERIKVKRTYINDLKKHGRIYVGHWQSCKSYKRATITINDVETVEVDIANCSLRIVLQLSKIDASGDLYIIKDYPRALVKDTINMMFNIGDGVRSYAQGVERTVKALLDKYKDCERSYLKGLVLDCYEHYKVIADEWFFQGRGLDLHYLDSRVCMNVIEEFTKDNQVVLTVHDSYIVKKELEHKLRQSITKNYSLIIGREPILT